MASLTKQAQKSDVAALSISDENVITLDAEAWTHFEQALERPPQNIPALAEYLRRKPVWD